MQVFVFSSFSVKRNYSVVEGAKFGRLATSGDAIKPKMAFGLMFF
jgi:hypothetical protein